MNNKLKKITGVILSLMVTIGTLTPSTAVFAEEAKTYSLKLSFAEGVIVNDKTPSATLTFKDGEGNTVAEGEVTATISKAEPTVTLEGEIPAGAVKVNYKAVSADLGAAKVSFIQGTEKVTGATNIGKVLGSGFDITLSDDNITAEVVFGSTPTYVWDEDSVYLAWVTEGTAKAGLYYHKFTGIKKKEAITAEAADVKAETDSSVSFDLSKQKLSDGSKAYEFVWSSGMEAALADEDFVSLDTGAKKLAYLKSHGMTVDGAGSNPASAHSINTAGAGNFSLTIAEASNYKPVSIKAKGTSYITEFDSEIVSGEVKDINGTSEDEPFILKTFLLENSVELSGDNISSIVAENGAKVNVTGYNGKWTVTFKTNFCDDVILSVKFKDGSYGFIEIVRRDLRIVQNTKDSSSYYAEVVYPTNSSYKQYKIIGTGVTDNGTYETFEVTSASKDLQDASGNDATGYELAPAGTKGIKKAWYKLPDISKYSTVYLNAVKTSSNSNTFGGALQGNVFGTEFRSENGVFKRVLSSGNLL